MNLAKKKIVIITGNSLRHKYIKNIILNSSKFKVSLIIQEIHKKKIKKITPLNQKSLTLS